LVADGAIIDQGGPGVPGGAAGIPTLSEPGKAILASLLMLGTLVTLRRRRL
jgi:MYXO-CTERM domain-containing protein